MNRTPLVGDIVTDRYGVNHWVFVAIEKQYVYIHTYPTPAGEIAIPIPLDTACRMPLVPTETTQLFMAEMEKVLT